MWIIDREISRIMKKTMFAAIFAAVLIFAPAQASAHEWDRDDADYPLRVAAYVLHPIGIAIEYLVLRPIHAIVSSSKDANIIFGHDTTEDEPEDYFEWK
jgi:hypothetical protein